MAGLIWSGAHWPWRGLLHLRRSLRGIPEKIKEAGLGHKAEEAMIKTGKLGYVSRGAVWGVLSYLLARAALDAQKGGAGSVFHFLESALYGAYLLAVVALGLICYSLFVFIEAGFRYRSR
ncbi:DUF1206 domain-containing protein [Pontibacter rugosus]